MSDATTKPAVPDRLLILSVFVVASCGLAYELIAGALSSYLLGDSVLQFSSIIGCYLFAMGVGSHLSKYVDDRDVLARVIDIELLVGLIGGVSAIRINANDWAASGGSWGRTSSALTAARTAAVAALSPIAVTAQRNAPCRPLIHAPSSVGTKAKSMLWKVGEKPASRSSACT